MGRLLRADRNGRELLGLTRATRRPRAAWWTLGLLLWAGCDAGADPNDAVAAAATAREADARSAWLRITPAGLRALPAALQAQLARGRSFPLPRARLQDLTLCTTDGCAIELALRSLSLSPRADGSLGLGVAAQGRTGEVPVRYEQTWPCAFTGRPECSLDVDTSRAAPPFVTATAQLTIGVDRATGLVGLGLDQPTVPRGIDAGDVQIAGTNTCGRVWCSVANLAGASGWVAERANAAIVEALRREAQARLCLPCDEGRCPAGTACVEGICRDAQGCAPLPLATRALIPAVDERAAAALTVAVADVAEARRGNLEVALRLSAEPTRRHPCAPSSPAPAPVPLPREILDGGTETGALRIALGEAAIARALWALHQAGIGCLDVNAEAVPLMRPGLPALFPSARRIAALRLGPPTLGLRALGPPEARVEQDGSVSLEALVRIEASAPVLGRTLRVAYGAVRLTATAGLSADAAGLVLEIPRGQASATLVETWTAPVLGATSEELSRTFEALAQIALAILPDRISLAALPVPGRLGLAAPPRGAGVGEARAIVIDLQIATEDP